MASLLSLPNEIILHVLSSMSTTSLLPLSGISQRFYALVCRVLHRRLQLASQLPEHTLLLECYHPSAKLTEPPFYCTYQGTEGLDVEEEEGSGVVQHQVGRIGEYKRLYSVYQPQRRPPDERARRLRHPAGDVPGSRTHPSSAPSWVESSLSNDVVRQQLMLDSHELFTQLIANLNLARSGPRRGLFFSFVDVGEGVVRVWRDWLRAAATSCDADDKDTPAYTGQGLAQGEKILWVDTAQKVGLRLRVRESKWRRNVQMPVLMTVDEDMPVSYEIEYQELVVRTSHLVFTLEESMTQQSTQSGKAIVFGSFG